MSSSSSLVVALVLVLVISVGGGQAAVTIVATPGNVQSLPELAAVTGSVPMTLAFPLAKGDLPATTNRLMGALDGVGVLPNSQFQCLRTWSDGSCKHGFVAASLAPADITSLQTAGATGLNFGLVRDDAATTPAAKTKAEAISRLTSLAALPSRVDLSNGFSLIADSTTLNNRAIVRIQGPEMVELVLADSFRQGTTAHEALTGEVVIRVFFSSNIVHFDWALNNVKTNLTTDVRQGGGFTRIVQRYPYAATFVHPSMTNVVVSGVDHQFGARWRHQVFFPTRVSQFGRQFVNFRPNFRYWSFTRILPSYDYAGRPQPNEAEIAREYTDLTNANNAPMFTSVITPYMPGTGERQDLGIFPEWISRYILSNGDIRLAEIVLQVGTASAAFPIHHAGVNFLVTPEATSLAGAYGNQVMQEDTLSATNNPDCAHQPSMGFFPYLMTGQKFYSDELDYWSTWNLIKGNPGSDAEFSPTWAPGGPSLYRGFARGYLDDQTRGTAWCLRSIAHASEFLPTAWYSNQPYWKTVVDNNFHWLGVQTPASNTMGYYPLAGYQPSGNFEDADPTTTWMISPWMGDFLTATVFYLDQGLVDSSTGPYITYRQAIRNHLGKFIVGRFTANPDFDRSYGAPYRMAVQHSGTRPAMINTWADLWRYGYGQGSLKAKDGLGDCGPVNPTQCEVCYPFIARGTLRMIHGGGTIAGSGPAKDYLSTNLNKDIAAYKWSFADTLQSRPALYTVSPLAPPSTTTVSVSVTSTTGTCQPLSSCPAGRVCGAYPDGCGGTVACGGTCTTYFHQTCNVNTNQCECTPHACSEHGWVCGNFDNGCGSPLSCGGCPGGESCIGNGTSCSSSSCTLARSCPVPQPGEFPACGDLTTNCTEDGRSITINCGICIARGRGAVVCNTQINKCACTPLSTADACAGVTCGTIDNGCGGLADCGPCQCGPNEVYSRDACVCASGYKLSASGTCEEDSLIDTASVSAPLFLVSVVAALLTVFA